MGQRIGRQGNTTSPNGNGLQPNLYNHSTTPIGIREPLTTIAFTFATMVGSIAAIGVTISASLWLISFAKQLIKTHIKRDEVTVWNRLKNEIEKGDIITCHLVEFVLRMEIIAFDVFRGECNVLHPPWEKEQFTIWKALIVKKY